MVIEPYIPFHYGTGKITLQVPEKNIQTTIRPWQLSAPNGVDDPLTSALRGPSGEAFRDAIDGKNICVLVPDCTRRTPFTQSLPVIMNQLQACAQVQFLISTGTHLFDTPANQSWLHAILDAARAAGLAHVKVSAHHCRESLLRDLGKTQRGTPVVYNAGMDDADVFLALSDVKVHYFVGYSNPIKNIVPGVCGYRTVEANHSWALHKEATYGRHPWHAQRERQHNPLALDQLEAARRIIGTRPFYALYARTGICGEDSN